MPVCVEKGKRLHKRFLFWFPIGLVWCLNNNWKIVSFFMVLVSPPLVVYGTLKSWVINANSRPFVWSHVTSVWLEPWFLKVVILLSFLHSVLVYFLKTYITYSDVSSDMSFLLIFFLMPVVCFSSTGHRAKRTKEEMEDENKKVDKLGNECRTD